MTAVLPVPVTDESLVSDRCEVLPDAVAHRLGGLVDRITLIVPADTATDAACGAAGLAIRAR